MALGATTSELSAGGLNLLGRGAGGFFPDPFQDEASRTLPRTIADAMRWTEQVALIDGTYREAMRRVASYFITDVIVTAGTRGKKKTGQEEKQKFEEFLRKKLKIGLVIHEIAMDYLIYGNSFSSIYVPFRRYLSCPKCRKFEAPFSKIANTPALKFKWTDFEFHATCPLCRYAGKFNHNDRPGGEESEIRIKRWSPHEIEIRNNAISGDKGYVWTIPEKDRRPIRQGQVWDLERAPWEVIQAVKAGNKLLFDPGYIYHMQDPAMAGLDTGGWGLPKAVSNFRQVRHCQVLRRYNEEIAIDYIMPFRVITPAAKSGADGASSDPVLGSNLGRFRSQIAAMLRQRQRNPKTWHTLPFPIDYQALGGEATQLAPFQLIDQSIDQLLNAAGVPAELYKGTLSVQAAPAALRLFESHWTHLVDQLNGFLEATVDKLSRVLSWAPVDAALEKVQIADDMNRQMAKLQLMMGRAISQHAGLSPLGLDFKQEQIRMLEEQQFVQEKTQEMQEEMAGQQGQQQFSQQAGQAPAAQPGQPAAPGGGTPEGAAAGQVSGSTPEDLMAQAEEIAGQFRAMPATERRSQLIGLKKQNPTLHALVKSQLERQDQQDATQGKQQIQAQQQQQQQAAFAKQSSPTLGAVTRFRFIRFLEELDA